MDGRWLALLAAGAAVGVGVVSGARAGMAGSQVRVGPRLRSSELEPEPSSMTITVINRAGRPFTVRVVRPGDKYGLNDVLTFPGSSEYEQRKAAAGDVLVEFYDASQDLEALGLMGQFVSRYYLSSLDHDLDRGRDLALHGDIPEWTVSKANVAEAIAFAREVIARKSGSSVRVGPRLRVASLAPQVRYEPTPFGPFGKQIRTGMRVIVFEGRKPHTGTVTAARDTTYEKDSSTGSKRRRIRFYGVTFDDGFCSGFLWPRDTLFWPKPSDPSGSLVRVGPRLRLTTPPLDSEEWVPFGRRPVVTGMRVKIVQESGIDSGKIGTVTQERGYRYKRNEYSVDLGSPEIYTWPKSRLLRSQPRIVPLVDRSVKLARVRLVHKISPSDKDTKVIGVALGDLDTIESIVRWLKGDSQDPEGFGTGRFVKWRKEPNGTIVLFPSGSSSWHSVIIEPIVPGGGSSNRARTGPSVLLRRLEPLRAAMEDAFSCATAFGDCRTDRPSTGHCMLAAMVVQDVFGGCILHAEVDAIPHYWNQVGGLEVDLTADQFGRLGKPPVRVAAKGGLYPGSTVFPRAPGESLVPSLNAELLGRHRVFVDALVPAMRRQGLGRDAACVKRIVDAWPVVTRDGPHGEVGSRVRVGPRLRPSPSSGRQAGKIVTSDQLKVRVWCDTDESAGWLKFALHYWIEKEIGPIISSSVSGGIAQVLFYADHVDGRDTRNWFENRLDEWLRTDEISRFNWAQYELGQYEVEW